MIYRANKASADGLTPFRSLAAAGLVKLFNHDNVGILLRGGMIENAAAGKMPGAAVSNEGGVSVNGNGNFVFDGSNYVVFSGHGINWTDDDLTFDICLKLAEWPGSIMFLSGGSEQQLHPELTIHPNGNFYGYQPGITPACPFSLGQFTQLTLQYTRSTGEVAMWTDGVYQTATTGLSSWGNLSGWLPDNASYMFGRDLVNGGIPSSVEVRYFRVCNARQYTTGQDFSPNLMGV